MTLVICDKLLIDTWVIKTGMSVKLQCTLRFEEPAQNTINEMFHE